MTRHDTTREPRTTWSLRLAAMGLAGLGTAMIAPACSLVLGSDGGFLQCQTDSDCDKFDGDWVCDTATNICVEDGNADDSTGGDGDGDPGDGDGDPGDGDPGDGDGDPGDGDPGDGDPGDGDGDPTGCSTHTECTARFDDDYMCNCQGVCVNMRTTSCAEIDWPNGTPADNVTFIGSIMPTSAPFDTLVLPMENSSRMAVADFNGEAELNDGNLVGWVGCNSQGGTMAVSVAEHLVDELCVPAIIGPVFSESVIAVAEQVTIDKDVFLISPTGSNKEITNLDDKDLVWRTIASDVYQAEALADRLEFLVGAAPGNVVMLHKNDAYGNDLAMDTFALANNVDFTDVFAYDLQADPMNPIVDLGSHIANTLTTDNGMNPPEYVVLVGTSEVIAFILGYLQTLESQQNPVYPQFVVTHGAVAAMVDTIKHPAVLDNDPAQMLLYATLQGVSPVIFDEQNFAAFNIRYNFTFNEQNTITSSSLAYDATLVTLFAMTGIPENEYPITGPKIAAQMGKLIDPMGTYVSFGPQANTDFIPDAVNQLAIGGTVDLQGVSGVLDFDLDTGDVRTNLLGWQVVPLQGNLDNPELDAVRLYVLNPEPATDGVWMDLP